MLCSLFLAATIGNSDGFQLPAEFPNGWTMSKAEVSSEPKAHGSAVVRLAGGAGSTVRIDLRDPPGDRKMVFSLWLKGTAENQWISVKTYATKGDARPAQTRINLGEGYVTTEYARLSTSWKLYTKSIVVSRSAKNLAIEVSNPWKDPLFVAAPSLALKGKEMCDLDGPGILDADLRVWVRAAPGHETGTIAFPIPIRYADQVPLAMRLTSNEPNAIESYEFRRRPDGLNWLCEVRVRPGKRGASVEWEALVFTRSHTETILPKANSPSYPPDVQGWLQRTACVQTDSPLILAKAAELSHDDPDVETYARRVIRFTCDNRGSNETWSSLDAEMALKCAGGGSCTNRANLAAALLRIRGIPARTVAHLPTWCYGETLFTHWLVEYWHPGAGWVSLESTWGEFEPPPFTTAIVAISSTADEEKSFDPVQSRWVMPGAPMWAVPHIDDNLVPDRDKNQQANWARPEQRIAGTPEELAKLFEKASAKFESLMASKRIATRDYFARIRTAMKSGRATTLAAALGSP